MPKLLFLAITLGTALGGCGSTPPHASRAPLVIGIASELPDTCFATVAGRRFTLPAEDAALMAALRDQARTTRTAVVSGGIEAPYRCFGGAIYRAQQAGFARVTFVAEPPPPQN